MANRRSALETLKADLEARLARYTAHQRREAGAPDKDFDEQAHQTQNDEVVDSRAVETRSEVEQVAHALERLDEGLGDECEGCGDEIDPRRLQVLPYTTLCVDCAEKLT